MFFFINNKNFFKCNFTDTKLPLPEDKKLQGFLPLTRNFKEFDFKEDCDDAKIEKLVRMKRIINISVWLTEIDINGNKLIIR